jgi:hypothetical protein
MPTTERPVPDKGEWFTLKAIRHVAIYYGVRVGFVVAVGTFILAYLDIVKDQQYLLGIVLVLIVIMSEQLLESDRQIRKQATSIESVIEQVREQATALESVIENANPRLYALSDAIKDFDTTLASIPPPGEVVIEHLGLNQTQAWLHIEEMLRKHQHLTGIDYKMLILTDDTKKIPSADDEVKAWALLVPHMLKTIKKEVNNIIDQSGDPNKMRFEVRKYCDIPVIHGVRMVSPRPLRYMAFCRWEGGDYQKYGWGEPQYHKIVGDPPSDNVSPDMLKIYHGFFQHLWKNSDPGFVLPEPAEPQQAKG